MQRPQSFAMGHTMGRWVFLPFLVLVAGGWESSGQMEATVNCGCVEDNRDLLNIWNFVAIQDLSWSQ